MSETFDPRGRCTAIVGIEKFQTGVKMRAGVERRSGGARHRGHGWFPTLLLVAGAIASLFGVASANASGKVDLLSRATVAAHGRQIEASPGTSERVIRHPDGTTGAFIGDAFPPLKLHGRLPVRPGQRITIRTALRAVSITLRVTDRRDAPRSKWVHATPIGQRGQLWAVRLPRQIGRDADRVSFNVVYYYQQAYTNFEAGIRVAPTALGAPR
ncbi:MAG: hypothetical protein ACR2KV_10705 [Solirubrobacteraceae bacterium]